MSVHVSSELTPVRIRRSDRGFLNRNPWGVGRERIVRTAVWLPLALLGVALHRSVDRDAGLVLVCLGALVAGRVGLELRREARRGWVADTPAVASVPGGVPVRYPTWHDPSGEWIPARDSLAWRPLRLVVGLTPLATLATGLAGSHGAAYFLSWLVAWPVLVYLFRHIPTGSRYDVAHHCRHCGRHGAYRLCRRCGRVALEVRPPTEFGSLRRRWRFC